MTPRTHGIAAVLNLAPGWRGTEDGEVRMKLGMAMANRFRGILAIHLPHHQHSVASRTALIDG
jgi:hypothetical protein